MYEDCQLIPPSDDANSTKKLTHAGTTRSIGFYHGYTQQDFPRPRRVSIDLSKRMRNNRANGGLSDLKLRANLQHCFR